MKSIALRILVAAIVLAGIPGVSHAQVVKVQKKEYKKAVKKKTKELKKKGYAAKGSGTIEIYTSNALNKEFDVDE